MTMLGKQNIAGQAQPKVSDSQSTGRFTRIDGEPYYAIHDYDRLDPFLMSVVSDSDHWMFVSSNGGLTAGRANPERALFPYDSEDKIHQCHTHTGPRTALWISHPDKGEILWEPFTRASTSNFRTRKHLYKSVLCNALVFEEVNHDLDLTFRYRWRFSERYGFVRRSTLANAGEAPVDITLLDGLLNVLPYGITTMILQQRHCLADAYKHCQVDPQTGLGIYSLSSMITDRPEPGETMYATSVWGYGLASPAVVLCSDQFSVFRRRKQIRAQAVIKGRKGAYLLNASLRIDPGQLHHWHIVADVAQNQQRIARLRKWLGDDSAIIPSLQDDCGLGDQNLRQNVAGADGLQATGCQIVTAHHFANVLFNNMRGGVFNHHYDVGRGDLARFVSSRNREVARHHADFFKELEEVSPIRSVLSQAEALDDPDLLRLCYEYLPIYFSRRHGDPSRPWNHFDIRLKDDQGRRVLAFQGNWRDIFQNWEALCMSFPGFLPSVTAKFVNASTADGFNPYRITSDGIDWEVLDDNDPWSNIGYWGDHQIIYLLKLLESLNRFYPDELSRMMTKEVFSYAEVPYTIKSYEQILEDPHDTIEFDTDRAGRVDQRVRSIGVDGRLLTAADGQVCHVSLAEKLLVPALSKLSNLVVEGGLWLNTQRPEWNDANNALVGNGLSVVTLCYLRRYLAFCGTQFESLPGDDLSLTREVGQWLDRICQALETHRPLLEAGYISDTNRKRLLDALGGAFSDYRHTLYTQGLTDKTPMPRERIDRMIVLALEYVDHSIRANRRADGMYHAYNLMDLSPSRDSVSIRYLYEMLEGQVAVLSSGVLSFQEVLTLLDALSQSAMYRRDQNSYLLYPDRELPGFLEKNIVPPERVAESPLLQELIKEGDDRVVIRDDEGNYRFNCRLHNVKPLAAVLETLGREPRFSALVKRDTSLVMDIYEQVFDHKSFTGRSGGMYGYEGLGCIYWHMVSKLLLAVQECHSQAVERGAHPDVTRALAEAYYRIRGGLGFNKTPAQYGAFPTDPYSHTPGFAGARQPGMTGQVKEEILTRMAELGVIVEQGTLRFAPSLIRAEEFLKIESSFTYYQLDGQAGIIELPQDSIGFTFCQVPVVYLLTESETSITITFNDGQTTTLEDDSLSLDTSRLIFDRTGRVTRIDVSISKSMVTR